MKSRTFFKPLLELYLQTLSVTQYIVPSPRFNINNTLSQVINTIAGGIVVSNVSRVKNLVHVLNIHKPRTKQNQKTFAILSLIHEISFQYYKKIQTYNGDFGMTRMMHISLQIVYPLSFGNLSRTTKQLLINLEC